MASFEPASVDMILCDLPYGITNTKWDIPIPFEPLWEQYKRVIKRNGAIVLTASQPFTSALIMSNPSWFRYEWIWEKDKPSNFGVSKYQPLKYHENVVVFYRSMPTYNPVMWKGKPNHSVGKGIRKGPNEHGQMPVVFYKNNNGMKFPRTIQKFNRETGLHSTQKPVALFEYMIRTYTNEGDVVLDNAAGSGTTGIACLNTNREYILIENNEKYYETARRRLEEHESRSL
jgi:site-specific DNA-methyltransferase (adenine-specific)